MKKGIFYPKLLSLYKSGILKSNIENDIIAGIIVGIVALPLAIAFAVASGVSPEKGLITAIIAGFLISLLGGSRVQIGGPTGAFIVIVYGIVAEYGLDGLLISTLLAGIILIAFGLLRMGSILKFIPQPLIVGFTSGIAVVIFSSQIKDALGLGIDKLPSEFIEKWSVIFSNIATTDIWTFIFTITSILITVYFKKVSKFLPGSFVAIILLTIAANFVPGNIATIGSMFGEIPNTISFDLPNIDLSNIHNYIAPAFTIAMLGAIESLLSAVVADGMIGGSHRSNTELIAQGIANILSPIFGGIPATGAIARTATNIKNGGRSPIAGIVHAITLLAIMLFFGQWAKLIPMSALAGILIVVAFNMSEWRSFKAILKGSTYDIVILLTTFFLTVIVDLTIAIEIGLVLSALLFMQRMSKMCNVIHLEKISDDIDELPTSDKINVYEISGPFFFAAAKRYSELLLDSDEKTKIIILRMRHVPFVDSTGAKHFKDIIKFYHSGNKKLFLSGIQPGTLSDLDKNGITELLGKKNIFTDYNEALKLANKIIDDIN